MHVALRVEYCELRGGNGVVVINDGKQMSELNIVCLDYKHMMLKPCRDMKKKIDQYWRHKK